MFNEHDQHKKWTFPETETENSIKLITLPLSVLWYKLHLDSLYGTIVLSELAIVQNIGNSYFTNT